MICPFDNVTEIVVLKLTIFGRLRFYVKSNRNVTVKISTYITILSVQVGKFSAYYVRISLHNYYSNVPTGVYLISKGRPWVERRKIFCGHCH